MATASAIPRRVELPPGPSPLPVRATRIESDDLLRTAGAHTHGFFSLLLVERGDGSQRIGRQEWHVEDGDLYAVAPGEFYDASALGGTRGWVVSFTPDAVVARAGRGTFPLPGDPRWAAFTRQARLMGARYRVERPVLTRAAAHAREIAHELDVQAPGYQEVVRAQLVLLLVMATRVALPELDDVGASTHPVLSRVFALIDERFADDLSVASLAREVAVSHSQLSRIVRRVTGETVMHWVDERRMTEARRLLLETGDKLAVVSRQAGYRDATYFGRRFRQLHGVPPTVWQQLNR